MDTTDTNNANSPLEMTKAPRKAMALDVRDIPQAPGPEKGVLALMTMDPATYIGQCITIGITEDYFYLPAHQLLWNLFQTRYNKNQPIDIVSITQTLEDMHQLEAVGGSAGLAEIYTFTTTGAYFEHYLNILKDKFILRSIIKIATQSTTQAFDNPEDVPELLDSVETNIFQIRERYTSAKDEQSLANVLKQAVTNFEKFIASKGQIQGLTTGFEELDKKSKYLPDSIQISTSAWAGEKFSDSDALIFIGATGIAVRSIAPYVASKKSDPAVLVVDECGKFVISLLSGHLGGANELALKTAEILEAIPVVTTATDLHHRFAVDVFAKKNNCSIFNMKAAKEVSAALLAGKKVGFYSEFPVEGELPEGLVRCDEYGNPVSSMDDRSEEETQKSSDFNGTGTDCTNIDCGVAVTVHTSCNPFISTTQVVPKCLTLGMGCRKDKDARGIAEAAQKVLDRSGFHKEAFEQIASIDLKKEEKGILSLSQDWQIPFVTYTEEELKQVPGEFTPSPFVKKITGVDNVCERSAVLASGNGRLLQRKTGENGVTTAVAAREWRIHFE